MTVQGNNIYYGHFTSDGNPTTIQFPGLVNFYYQMNWTQWNSTANPGVLKRAWFHSTMPDASYLGVQNTDGAATDESIRGTTGGFTPIDFRNPPTYTGTAITAVTAANPAQITSNAHGLVAGNIVRLTNVTGMQQISGMVFEVTNVVDANNFNVALDSSGFAAAGTGGTARKIFHSTAYEPFRGLVTNVTQAASAVVTLSIFNNASQYNVGERFKFSGFAQFGMTEIEGLVGEITAVSVANNTITVNIDSTGFTAFAFPASGAVPFTFPQVTPVGEDTTVLTGAIESRAFYGLELGSSVVGANNDDIKWVASTRELVDLYI